MNKFSLSLAGTVLCLLFFAFQLEPGQNQVSLEYPESWPAPRYDFEKNPLTEAKIELGRKLFYDPILSADNTISCASCHLSFTAFTHTDHALSHGIEDRIGFRNSGVLINMAWQQHFMWDGAVNHLDMQALAPIGDSTEMDESFPHVIEKLQATEHYPALFETAFGSKEITGERFLKAMAQFQLTLISANSKYDQVMAGQDSFTVQEANGYRLFQQNCASCHAEPLFTTGDFANNGLPLDSNLLDMGRMRVSQLAEDARKFKIPTLRNIEFSAPYMHDGRFRKLREVLNHYSDEVESSPTLAAELQTTLPLNDRDKVDILSFLLTLSDREFLFNPAFGFPRP